MLIFVIENIAYKYTGTGGSVEVSSTSGQGSEFVLALPQQASETKTGGNPPVEIFFQ